MQLKTLSLKELKGLMTIPAGDRTELAVSVSRINIRRIRLIIKILIILETAVFIFTLLYKGSAFFLKPDVYYLTLYILFVSFLIPIMFLFIKTDKNNQDNSENMVSVTVSNVAVITFTVFILCMCVFFSLLDQSRSGHINVYSAAMILVAVFIYYKPLTMLFIYVCIHLIFIILLPYFQSSVDIIFGNIVYGSAVLILSWVLSYMRYIKYADDFYKTMKLKKENDELTLINKELDRLSKTDPLTGVYNRYMFDLKLRDEWNRCKNNYIPLSLIMVDIDSLKKINDNYGHQAGDYCVIGVSNALSSYIENTSGILARYGGDEFIILITDMDKDHVTEFAEHLRREVERQTVNVYSENLKHITVSLGICTVIPTDNSAVENILFSADAAMYAAKKHRNKIVVA